MSMPLYLSMAYKQLRVRGMHHQACATHLQSLFGVNVSATEFLEHEEYLRKHDPDALVYHLSGANVADVVEVLATMRIVFK